MPKNQHTPLPCPYAIGATFCLTVSPPSGIPYTVRAAVTHAYAPFSISPVMRIAVEPITSEHISLPSTLILKVYDRRFATDLREMFDGGPATYNSEALYREYLESGNILELDEDTIREAIYDVATDGYLENCPPHLFEHLVAARIAPYFEGECAVYERLASLQGKDFPTFYGTIRFIDDLNPPKLQTPIPGILLEFIPGTNLDKIDPVTVELNTVVSNAIRIVNSYRTPGVLNRSDVRLENFIVRPDGQSVVMIDFAQTRLRGEGETDQDWKCAKWIEDEEGAVGCVAMGKWKKCGYMYARTEEWSVSEEEREEWSKKLQASASE